ncbi:MAG: DUF3369 domain-containing protein, partial [Planctomycetia bacterium]
VFCEEDLDAPAPTGLPGVLPAAGPAPWKVLVADDDEGVQQVTRLALRGFAVDGVPLHLLEARSAAEGRALLAAHPDIAVVLLDVVMETDSAGLDLARWVRAEWKNPFLRVLLRTGQPGVAPEASVMASYEIHDYHAKTELTAQRLRTAITGSVRAYRDLRALARQRRGLERVLAAAAALHAPGSVEVLLDGLLKQVTALLLPNDHALLFVDRAASGQPGAGVPRVVAAAGRYAAQRGEPVTAVLAPEALAVAAAHPHDGSWVACGQDGLLGFALDDGLRACLFLEGASRLGPWERSTLASFCRGAHAALASARAFLEREQLLAAFERFVPRDMLRLVGHNDVRAVRAGDQATRTMCVMFVELRDLTSRAADLGGRVAFQQLARVAAALHPVIAAHGGVVHKQHGDQLLVLFPDGPGPALAAAVALQEAVRALQARGPQPGGPLALGITLHHGPVMVGAVGLGPWIDTAVLSEVASVAAGLQVFSRLLDASIVATDVAHAAAPPDAPEARHLGAFPVRGHSSAVSAVEVFAGDPAPLREAKRASRATFERASAARNEGRREEAAQLYESIVKATPADLAAAWLAASCRTAARRRDDSR